MRRKQNNPDWKSDGPYNIPFPKNVQNAHFMVEHHLNFSNEKKTPFLGTLEPNLECKS